MPQASIAGFFFQAEDSIRYTSVTGVQTCALPISLFRAIERANGERDSCATSPPQRFSDPPGFSRSEERRVGKESTCMRKERISTKSLMRLSICLWKPSIGDRE